MRITQQRRVLQLVLWMGILSLYLAQPAQSEDSGHGSARSSQCENAQTTATMRQCENIRYKEANDKMMMAYQNLLKKYEKSEKLKLQLAQMAWLKYRDAEADSQAAAAEDGTLAPLIRISVMADLTEARWGQLFKRAEKSN
jgi:uncharacterized protein YecT (DUF1311 family)